MSDVEIWVGITILALQLIIQIVSLGREIAKNDLKSDCLNFTRTKLSDSGEKSTSCNVCSCLGKPKNNDV